MAKKKSSKNKVSFNTIRNTKPSERINLTEIAFQYVEEYNAYAGATEDLPLLTADEFAMYLDKLFEAPDVEFLLHTDYGRGMMAGSIAVLYSLEKSMEPKIDALEEMFGEDIDTAEMAEAIRSHVKGFKSEESDDGSSNKH